MNSLNDSLQNLGLDTPEIVIEKLQVIYPSLTWEIADKGDTAYADDDVSTQLIGLVIDETVIFDLFSSDCGRFKVNPEEAYGISCSVAESIKQYNNFV